jgi:hypothetical protein
VLRQGSDYPELHAGIHRDSLTYVIRLHIVPKDWKRELRFGQVGSCYGSIYEEMVARAPIVAHNSAKRTPEQLKEDGPFTSAFSTDTKKVYLVLCSILGANSAWQHVKKYQQAQAGRKVWRVIHAHFFGGDKATALSQQTLKRLGDLRYDGNSNPKNWSFDKYTIAHVSQHNILHSLHVDYGVDAVPETMKIKYYQDGISDPKFDSVHLSILTSPHIFATFDRVKDHYTTFKRTITAYDTPGTTRRGILSFRRGGPGRGSSAGGRGGGNDQIPRKPTQEEIDACTHIKAQRYDTKDYRLFSAAEKAKHWQLMHPNQKPRGAGTSIVDRAASFAGYTRMNVSALK